MNKNKPLTFIVTVDPVLAGKLDARVQQERQAEPGRSISRLDVVRSLLYKALVPSPSEKRE